jgi:hypothetical protein
MHKIEISGVVHQNLSYIFNLCNVEGITRSHHRRKTRYPKESLTLTLGRTREREREKERGENLGPWRRAPERRGPADGGELRWPEEVRDGGGGGGVKSESTSRR